MLVLSRKTGERIKIGDGAAAVWITVVEIANGKVRIGIEAHIDIPVFREELLPEGDRHGPEGR